LLNAEFHESSIFQPVDTLDIFQVLNLHKDVRKPMAALDATIPLLVAEPPDVPAQPFGHI